MKPFLQKLPRESQTSFEVIRVHEKVQTYPLHFHVDFELIYFEEYHGQILIHDTLFEPKAGDLLIIGPNITHANLDHISQPNKFDVFTMVIFNMQAFGNDFFTIPEMVGIKDMLHKLNNVFLYRNAGVGKKIEELILNLPTMAKPIQIATIIQVLFVISEKFDKHQKLLPENFIPNSNTKVQKRVDDIYLYLSKNFRNSVCLEEIAELVKMKPESVSWYFKKMTGKNIFEVLFLFRLTHVQKLLRETDLTISEIAYESGFNNLASFNKRFRVNCNLTPNQYRKKYQNKLGI